MYIPWTRCELVQNAADSIRKAEEASLIKHGAGRIDIELGHNSRSVVVRDNGTGIPTEEAGERLIDVGMSDKDIEHDAGFRGIGRLAGIAFCDALKFRTSAKGEAKATVLEFDCVGIRKAISPANRRILEMSDVLAKYVTESTEQAKPGDHFLEVTLAGINDSATEFLDIEDVEPYLQQAAPVDFDPQDFVFTSKIQSWARAHKLDLPTVSLVVTTPGVRRQIFKPYRNSYRTSNQRGGQVDVEIKDVGFVLDEKAARPQFWIWWGITDLPGTVGDDRVAGFRFRRTTSHWASLTEWPTSLLRRRPRRIAGSTHGMLAKSMCCVPVPFPTLGVMASRTRGHGPVFGESCFRLLRSARQTSSARPASGTPPLSNWPNKPQK